MVHQVSGLAVQPCYIQWKTATIYPSLVNYYITIYIIYIIEYDYLIIVNKTFDNFMLSLKKHW